MTNNFFDFFQFRQNKPPQTHARLVLQKEQEQADAKNSVLLALFLSTEHLSADFASQLSNQNPDQAFVSYSTFTAAFVQSNFTWDFQGSRVAKLTTSSNANVINDESLGSLLHKTVFDSSGITDDFLGQSICLKTLAKCFQILIYQC